MPSRTTPVRMTSNYMDKALETPKWIKRMSINDRLNYIVRMYSETCSDNWYLWIETAVEGAPKLIYQLLAISKVDVVKEVLETNYSCGLRQVLGSGKKAKRTFAQKAKVVFWKIEGVRARLFWYWLIIDAVTAYIVNWQSIVVEEQRCNHPPHAGPCILEDAFETLPRIGISANIGYNTREYDPSGWSGTSGIASTIAPDAPADYNVGAAISCVWSSPENITWHLTITDGSGHIVAISGDVTGPSNVPSHAACFGVATAPAPLIAFYHVNVVVTAAPAVATGHVIDGTFSVGLAQ